jgi:hypothetical protein
MLFYAVVAVRQVEIGLASMMSLIFGATAMLFGVALWNHPHFNKALACVALLGGSGVIVSGITTAYSGFSTLAMNVSMTATTVLLLWLVGLAVRPWKTPMPDSSDRVWS